MRKTITIIGVGDRRQGVSAKTNKPYDFTPVSFTYDVPFMYGVKAATANVAQDCMGDYTPLIDDVIEVIMHEDYRTGSVYIDAVL